MPQDLLNLAIFHRAKLLQQLRFLIALAMPFLALPLRINSERAHQVRMAIDTADSPTAQTKGKTVYEKSQAASREIETALPKIG